MEILLGGLFQIVIITMVASLLGIAKEVIIILIAAGLYRRFSGGVHCQAYYRCTISALIVFISLGYLVNKFTLENFYVYLLLTGVIGTIIVWKKAPVDNPVKPITEEKEKITLKLKSFLIFFLMILTALTTKYFGQDNIAFAILLGVVWQTFTLTSWGHAVINLFDDFLASIEKTLKREEGYDVKQN